MSADSTVVSLADRLRQRREELGLSQAQAARELDVARTAYRLWEMEAAKPSPDRWRLISRWLGVSVTTMLLAEELVTDNEAAMSEQAAVDFRRSGRDWDVVGEAKEGDFFAQARALIADGSAGGDISAEQAQALAFLVERIEQEREQMRTRAWEPTELRKAFPADNLAPSAAREAISFVGDGLPPGILENARLLTSELVSNSVRHGPKGPDAAVGLAVTIERSKVRVEISDGSRVSARPKRPSRAGGFGLEIVAAFASRWGAGRQGELNVTWFELDLPDPGSTLPDFGRS
jgi:transcriptional regulator with XRE-family HTH domain